MATISRLSRLVGGIVRGVDLASNTIVVGDIKVGGTGGTLLTKTLLDALLAISSDLASTANGKGASLVSIEDAGTYYTSTTVEGALAEAAVATAAVADDVGHLVTLSGRPVDSDDLGTFTGSIIPDGRNNKQAFQALETFIEALPSPMQYKGTYNATTNSPALANTDVGRTGWLYRVTVAGTQDFGADNISFLVGDLVVNNGSAWEKWDVIDAVISVNGQSGVVSLSTDDISEDGSPVNLWFTDARAKTAAVVNSTAGSETDQAPSVSAIKSYIATQVAAGAETMPGVSAAGEALSATTLYALRWGRPADSETSGRMYKADNDATSVDNFHVAGLIKTVGALSAGNALTFVRKGKLTATSHGFTVGQPIYLSTAGALTSTAPSADNIASVKVGMAADSNTIDVDIEIFGVN